MAAHQEIYVYSNLLREIFVALPSWLVKCLMPNEIGTLPMMDYALSIDEVEEITGIDFFPQIDVEEQAKLESKYDVRSWRVDGNKERARIEKAKQLKNN